MLTAGKTNSAQLSRINPRRDYGEEPSLPRIGTFPECPNFPPLYCQFELHQKGPVAMRHCHPSNHLGCTQPSDRGLLGRTRGFSTVTLAIRCTTEAYCSDADHAFLSIEVSGYHRHT
jgi:hypothetical protein